MSRAVEAAAEAWGAYFETLRPDNVERLRELAAPDIRFKDPFNDLRGVDPLIRVLRGMFEDASEVAFRMQERICQDSTCVLRWEFTCRPRRRLVDGLRIEGVSLVRFDGEGRVVEHVDYWDAGSQLYARLPVIGAILRAVARRLGSAP